MVDQESSHYQFLTETETILSDNFFRVELTRKNVRNVHILLHKEKKKKTNEGLSVFLEKRGLAGVDNNDLFLKQKVPKR